MEIRDRRNRELVTVIELLSPTNKLPGPDRQQYLAKRMELLNGPVHLVEIDLLRHLRCRRTTGQPVPTRSWLAGLNVASTPISGRSRCAIDYPRSPFQFAPDADARIDLQAILSQIYDDAGYADYIYEGVPRPRLSEEDAAWARAFLPQLTP